MTDDLLTLASDVARRAGDLAMAYFRTGLAVETKSDQTPVTAADREAEALIRKEIAAVYPDHRFLGEEMGGSTGEAEYLWVIDPIDGTKNFIRGLPFFATQLALLEHGRVLVGVSYAPALGELMAAKRGHGTTLNGEPVCVSAIGDLEQAFVLHGGLDCFVRAGSLHALSTLSTQVMSMRGHGDFYGYHLVAQGRVDAMIEASIHPWDIAACKLIVEEAGGNFTGFDGDATSLPPNSIASNGKIHGSLLQLFGTSGFKR
jgi:histidinol-phosphatase